MYIWSGVFFFFFKQKTAYEIYQCDWSSDVCSSDLMIQQVFLGDLPDRWGEWPDLGRAEMLALVPLAVLVVVIGVAPSWLIDVIDTFSQVVARG